MQIPNPCYVMEEKLLRRNLELIRSIAQRSDVEFILALKAFALWKSFPIFREYIRHTTASSLYEARLSYEEFGSKAHTYSPAYEDDTFPELIRYSSHITFNSLSQYERFSPIVQSLSAEKPSLGLRVNPEYSEIETELYNPCAPGSRFGVLDTQLPAQLPADIAGFHIHCHCESSAEAFVHTLRQIEQHFSPWFSQLRWINFGGGHLVTRSDYDVQLLVDTLQQFHRRYPHLQVIMEPGSAFAWQTGALYARVVDIVENYGIRTAILNVSFTCHMPDCLEMPYYPAVRGAVHLDTPPLPTSTNPDCVYRLGGNSCLSGDYMGLWQFDHPLQVGETIIFEDMIHYTTVKTNMFNGVNHPSLALLRTDGSLDVYRTFRYEDYRDRMC